MKEQERVLLYCGETLEDFSLPPIKLTNSGLEEQKRLFFSSQDVVVGEYSGDCLIELNKLLCNEKYDGAERDISDSIPSSSEIPSMLLSTEEMENLSNQKSLEQPIQNIDVKLTDSKKRAPVQLMLKFEDTEEDNGGIESDYRLTRPLRSRRVKRRLHF